MSYVGNKPAQTTIPADDSVTTAMRGPVVMVVITQRKYQLRSNLCMQK